MKTMNDVNCPYCNAEQDICHDDGFGYEQDVKNEQQCRACNKYFTFITSILYHYEVKKADCLNGAEHDFKPRNTFPKEYTKMQCSMCEETRNPTTEEMKLISPNDELNNFKLQGRALFLDIIKLMNEQRELLKDWTTAKTK